MPTGIFKRKPLTEEWRKKISENNARYWLGKKMPKEIGEKISKKLKGRILCPGAGFKIGNKLGEKNRGENNGTWKGGNNRYKVRAWLRDNKTKRPEKCEICQSNKRIHFDHDH
ncbi:MAG: hypothetical protein AABY22_29385, partial [Nanoarchaeota archaeon]